MQSPILSPLQPPPPSERHRVVLSETAAPTAAVLTPDAVAPSGVLGVPGKALGSSVERRTLLFGVQGAVFEGLFGGLTSLNSYVAINALGNWAQWEAEVTTLMSMLPSILMAFAMVYSSGGRVRKRRGYFLFVGVFGRLIVASVALLALFPNPFFFVALVAVQAAVCAGIAPALNHIWGANTSSRARGRIFTWFSVASEIANMLAAIVAAWLLDKEQGANFVFIYPVAGVIGLIGMLLFWRIRLRHTPIHEEDRHAPPMTERIIRAWRQASGLLRRDPEFRLYETGFFLYGVAFMMLVPVVPVLFKNHLHATYQQYANANSVLVQLVHLVAVPLIVRWAAGRRVTRVTRVAHVLLIGYPVLLAITVIVSRTHEKAALWIAYAAFVLFGAAMAVIHFVWNLGPVAFAKKANPLPYTSTHAALVGLRASVGFPIAYALMKLFPEEPLPIFVLAALFFTGAATVMTVLDRRLKRLASQTSTYVISH